MCFLYSLGGCQKEYSPETNPDPTVPPPQPPVVTAGITAKVNGAAFAADNTVSAVRGNGLIKITGISKSGKSIAITLTDSGIHVYQLKQQALNEGLYKEGTTGGIRQ